MKKVTKRKIWIILTIIVLFGVYMLIEPFWIQTVHITVHDPSIPETFDGFSMIFVSDIHHGPFFSRARLGRLVEKMNRLNPDLVLLGGDYVHRYDTKHVISFFAEMKNLKAEYGVYAVMGNHDYWMSEELTIREMQKNNVNLLRNNGVWIEKDGERFFLGGVDDLMAGYPDLQQTIQAVKEEDFSLVLSHNPDVAEKQSTEGVDWVLSGHTHGGQVTFFGLWAPIVSSSYGQKYRSGLVQKGDTSIFVTNGVGTITPPVRFFARPQIVVLTLN